MPFKEFEGKNIEQAIEKAGKQLKIDSALLEYNVISFGSSGIFGFGARKAKVRVAVPESPRPALSPKMSVTAPKAVETPPIKQPPAARAETDLPASAAAPIASEAVPVDGDDARHEAGRHMLMTLVSAITDDAVISVTEKSNRLMFDIRGGNSAVLIGKRGQTLEAIQYLFEKMFNKDHTARIRVQVDVEGYLENRKERLAGLANRLAQKALKSGKPVTIGQMNSHDRRIVHIALKDNLKVRTQSVGDGYLRKLVIFPKKGNWQRPRKPYRRPAK